jgi:hypothetical protein
MNTYPTTINETDVTVHYEYCPLVRGSTDGRFGPKLEPDEPEHIEIDRVLDGRGRDVDLSDDDAERIQAEIMNYLYESWYANEPDYGDDD